MDKLFYLAPYNLPPSIFVLAPTSLCGRVQLGRLTTFKTYCVLIPQVIEGLRKTRQPVSSLSSPPDASTSLGNRILLPGVLFNRWIPRWMLVSFRSTIASFVSIFSSRLSTLALREDSCDWMPLSRSAALRSDIIVKRPVTSVRVLRVQICRYVHDFIQKDFTIASMCHQCNSIHGIRTQFLVM